MMTIMVMRRSTKACSSDGSGKFMLSLLPPYFSSSSSSHNNVFHSIVDTLDEALSCFNRMLRIHPPPSIVDFNKLLTSISKTKHHSIVLSLSHQIDSIGIPPNTYTLNILINSFSHLNRLVFAFSVLAKILKLGHRPNIPTFTTLIRGLYFEGKIGDAFHLFDQ